MKRIQSVGIMMVVGLSVLSTQAQTNWTASMVSTTNRNTVAGSGTFTWSTAGVWDANGVANGAGLGVSLEPRVDTTDTYITVDASYTLGTLTARQISALHLYFLGTGKLIFDNGSSDSFWNIHRRGTRFNTLRADINIDVQLNSNLDIRMGSDRQDEAGDGRIGKAISGVGGLTLTLGQASVTNGAIPRFFKLGYAGANTYQGGTIIRHISQLSYGLPVLGAIPNVVQLNAVSTGAFGTGDVTINGTGCTGDSGLRITGRGMWVRFSTNNVISNGRTLNLQTASRIALELVGGTTNTVGVLTTNGVSIANGTYTGGQFDWLYGTGTLIVGTGGTPEPEMVVLGNNATEIVNNSTTVSQSLGTDFGQLLWNGAFSATNTFVITNTGLATLTLSGAPVSVLGDHSADFTVIQPASTSIPAGQSVAFKIACDPSALGVRTGLVSIANNDSNENPYTFKIQGTGTEPRPVMSILSSNGTLVVTNGTTVLSEALGTDFGEILWIGAVSVERTFVITNRGTASLTLTLPVTITGVDSANFTVTQPATSTIDVGQSVTFKIACDPSAVGVKTGLVSIVNNDTSPYRFNISAAGIPEQISFQQGDGGAYSGTAFTYLQERYGATNNFGNDAVIKLEEEYGATTHFLFQGLLGFTNIIGKANGQIPPNATVSSATLTLTVNDEGNPLVPITLHRMLKPWVENEVTWTQLSAGVPFGNAATNPLDNVAALAANPADPIDNGGGMPGVDYVEASTASHVAAPVGQIKIDVTTVVQEWVNGTPNYGLYIQYLDVNGVQMHSDDAATLGNRPRLVVSFTPPLPKGTLISFQ